MTNEKNISVEQFLAALQRQGSNSAIINAARKVEVDEVTEAEERALAKGIEKFAGTKNGPMLLMGLPGPLQALLSFSGTVMPGLDRLGCLKATPRQVVNRLLKEKDDLLLKKYPFERVDKTDWAHYFRSCNGDPVPPFLRFLKVPDSAGGFSDEEIGEGVLANRRMVDAVPLDRIQPDAAAELIVSGTAKPFWQKYDLARFGKEHWRKILMGVDLEAPPRECVRFLSNQGGRGFSNDELIELAHYRDFVSKWIDPEATPFKAAYALRVKGMGLELWRRFPFAKLGKTEWATLLANPQIDIPPAFAEAVKKDVFSVAELCWLAKKNKAVVDYIPCDKLGQTAFLDLFLATRSKRLWDGYDFSRLTGPGWKRLICSLKTKGIVNTANHIKTATGLTTEIVSCLLKVNPGYYRYVPVELISTEDVIKVLLSGECEPFWEEYPFERFSKADWALLFAKTDRIPASFDAVVNREVFSLGELCDYARRNESMVAYLPVARLNSETLTDLLILSKTDVLWEFGNLRRLTADCWVRLIQKRKPLIPAEYLKPLKDTRGLGQQHVGKILEVDRRYYRYVPSHLIPANHACAYFSTGYADDLWSAYDFRVFSAEQIKTIVAKSPEREKWPKEISDKFSSAEGTFSDSQILSLAETNIVNVIELLTPKRIHQSGEGFFGKICKAAKESKPAVAAITRKLTIGQKPWLELRQEYHVALLSAIPLCRKFVVWQEFDLKFLDKLLKADKAFGAELCRGRWLALLAWRYWRPFLIVALVIVAEIVCCMPHRRSDSLGDQKNKSIAYSSASVYKGRTLAPSRPPKNEGAGTVAMPPWNGTVCPSNRGNAAQTRQQGGSPNTSPNNGLEVRAESDAAVVRLHEEAVRLRWRLADASERSFLSVESAFSQLRRKAFFDRYRKEYAKEYDALGNEIRKVRNGMADAKTILAQAEAVFDSAASAKATEANFRLAEGSIRALEAWQEKFDADVKWKSDEVERCRERMIEHRAGIKERMALVSAINNAMEYGTLYESVQMLADRYPDSFECRRIDASRIPDAVQVSSATAKSGWLFGDGPYEFAGVIKVCPRNAQDVVPLLVRDVAPDADVYSVSPRRYDHVSGDWMPPSMKKIFTRTSKGGFRKVGDVDYEKCQGVGLFVRKGDL